MQTFSQKLRLLRKQHGMTQRELAEHLSTSSGYIADLEGGRRKPSLELARKMADIFEVSVDLLAKDELELEDEKMNYKEVRKKYTKQQCDQGHI